ncbi:MAG: terminase small subunit [Sphingomonadaceae bacterium]|nr:terminase small subunit [Sphingomonadaceae bacterium]
MSGLTPKRQRFVDEYLVDLNATRAYRDAGFKGNDNVCAVEGHRLLSNPNVAAAIKEAMDKRAERVGLTADETLGQLRRMLMFDPRKLLNDDGTPKAIGDLDDDTVMAVAGLKIRVERGKGGQKGDSESAGDVEATIAEYRLTDRVRVTELAMRHLKLLTDKMELTGRNGEPLVRETTPLEDARRIAFIIANGAQIAGKAAGDA